MVNANYTWFKCMKCGAINKVLPGQKFETAEDFVKLLECDCKVEVVKPKSKKVVKDAT